MKVIIAGSRKFDDNAHHLVRYAVKMSGFDITEVVSGGAVGIDEYGELWAETNHVPVQQFIPDWKTHGKKAGIIRNSKMAEYAGALIAIWDSSSTGTKDMIAQMKRRRKPIFRLLVGFDKL